MIVTAAFFPSWLIRPLFTPKFRATIKKRYVHATGSNARQTKFVSIAFSHVGFKFIRIRIALKSEARYSPKKFNRILNFKIRTFRLKNTKLSDFIWFPLNNKTTLFTGGSNRIGKRWFLLSKLWHHFRSLRYPHALRDLISICTAAIAPFSWRNRATSGFCRILRDRRNSIPLTLTNPSIQLYLLMYSCETS